MHSRRFVTPFTSGDIRGFIPRPTELPAVDRACRCCLAEVATPRLGTQTHGQGLLLLLLFPPPKTYQKTRFFSSFFIRGKRLCFPFPSSPRPWCCSSVESPPTAPPAAPEGSLPPAGWPPPLRAAPMGRRPHPTSKGALGCTALQLRSGRKAMCRPRRWHS